MAITYEKLVALFDGDISGLEKKARAATRLVDDVENRIKNFRGELKIGSASASAQDFKRLADSLAKITQETGKSSKELRDMAATQAALARSERAVELAKQATLNTQSKQLRIDNQRLLLQERIEKSEARKSGTGGRSTVDSDMRKAQADIRKMQADSSRAEKEITRSVEREAKTQADIRVREQKRAANEMLASIKRVQREEKAGNSKTSGGGLSVLAGSFLGSAAGNLAASAVSNALDIAKQGASVWLDYSASLEQTKIGFTTLLGSEQAAAAHLKDLQDFARTTPFEFAELTQASRRFQGVGVEASKVIPILTDIGNAAAAAGASSEKLKLITVAFSQIIAKGKLSAEEVNQLAENGIPAWDILSKQLGKTKAEVIKMAEAGEISSDVFLAAFQKFSRQNYGDAMQKQSRTFSGALSNITDALLQVSNTAFAPMFEQISKFAVDFADEIQAQGNDFEAVGEIIAKYIGKGLGFAVKEIAKGIGAILAKEITSYGKDSILDTAGFEFGNEVFNGLQHGTNYLFNSGADYEAEKQDIERWSKQRAAEFYKTGAQSLKFKPQIELGGNNYELDRTNFTLKEIKKTVSETPDLKGKLQSAEAQKQAEKLRDAISELNYELAFFGDSSREAATKQKLLKDGVTNFNAGLARSAIGIARQLDNLQRFAAVGKTIDDLKLRIQYFGDESEVAATKQKLLADGITDLSVGSAKAALSYAAQLDALKIFDEQKEKIKDLREEIVKVGQDARFEVEVPNANELDQFNRWVRDNAAAFRELTPEIAATREELKKLLFTKGESERTKSVNEYLENLKQSILDIKDAAGELPAELDFEKSLENLVKPLNLDKSTSPISGADFAKRIRDEILGFRDSLDREEAMADGIIGDPALIEQKLKERIGSITDRFYEFFDSYLSQFKKKTDDGSLINIFADSKDFENVNSLLSLWNAVFDARNRAFEKGSKEFSSQTNDAQFQAEREYIESLKAFGAEKETIRQAEFELERKREDQAHSLKLAELERQRNSLLALAQFEEQKLEITKTYNAQLEAENLRHSSVLSQIDSELGSRSIADRLRQMVGELPSYKQQFQDFITSLPTSLADSFNAGLNNLDDGWRGFLEGMKQSFQQTLLDLANQLLRSALIQLVTKLISSIAGGFGGGFGPASSVGVSGGIGSAGLPGLASGGTATGGALHLVGERGPELFVPNQTGRVVNNRETQKLLGQQGSGSILNVSINQTIAAPRGMVAPKSAHQAADRATSSISRLMKGNR